MRFVEPLDYYSGGKETKASKKSVYALKDKPLSLMFILFRAHVRSHWLVKGRGGLILSALT